MKLIRSTAIIGGLTLISRVLGLVRDVLIARFMGAGAISDAFFTAFKLPNVFRRMFAEGAFNAAFIPLYARRLEEGGEAAADAFASEAMSVLLVAVGAVVILFEITMPWSLAIIGYGLDRHVDPSTGYSTYGLAVIYAQITMPYLLFMSLAALFSGILNTKHYFALAAAIPIILNIFMITTLSAAGTAGWGQAKLGLALCVTVTLAGIAQMSVLLWGVRRSGVKIGLKKPRLTPGVKRLIVLGVPGMISAGITQINLLVSNTIATLHTGAASWLTYADRLYQLPLGMIGIAMGIALLPTLSRRLRAGDLSGANMSLNRAIEISAFLTLPAAFALAIIPGFLVEGLYQRGEFMSTTTFEVAKALRLFALGLPAFVMLKVMAPPFFAREDTRTPMIFAAISAAINIVLGIWLFYTIGFQGLALATSIAAWVNVICLTVTLLRRGEFTPDARLMRRLPRIALASAIMGASLYVLIPKAQPLLSGKFILDFGVLAATCLIGVIIYAVAAIALQAFDMSDIRDAVRRRPAAGE